MSQTNSHAIVIKVSFIAALAGLLFGLDVAYVNGTLGYITKEFNLDVAAQGSVAGYLLAGAAVGALFSGWLSRVFGRKRVLVLSATLFTFSVIFTILSHTFSIFLVARFVTGLAIGIASFVAPLYLSEIAPYKIRGALIAMYQLMITIGIFAMFLSNAALSFTGSWRIMLAVLLIPSLIMLIGTLTLPESPRFMALVGKMDKAREILNKIRSSSDDIELELREIKETSNVKSRGFSLLSKGYFWKVILLGILLQCLQQMSGINAMMYYSGQIFEAAGFTNPAVGTVIVGLVNVLTTLIAIKFVDKLGRKPILYLGLFILVVSCAIIGYIFNIQTGGVTLNSIQQYTLLVFCLLFIFGFAVSLGPIIWIICPEIFPLGGRDLGVTVTTMANWIFNAIIGSYTLVWFKSFGVGETFWMFGLASLLGFILVKFFTPETKDVPLEELELNLEDGIALKNLGKRRV
ncbi:MAG: transporter [Burkholderiales bacterium]|jgi:SP family galactose:H+ symporter-like MFS transporter|nr:transporter [Burkholderiales bacterium]